MKKSGKTKKVVKEEPKKIAEPSQYMKALFQSKILNNFTTNFQFTRDLGIELLKGSATLEHVEVLKKSIEGIVDFISILNEKIKELETK